MIQLLFWKPPLNWQDVVWLLLNFNSHLAVGTLRCTSGRDITSGVVTGVGSLCRSDRKRGCTDWTDRRPIRLHPASRSVQESDQLLVRWPPAAHLKLHHFVFCQSRHSKHGNQIFKIKDFKFSDAFILSSDSLQLFGCCLLPCESCVLSYPMMRMCCGTSERSRSGLSTTDR